jgi:hypothetical protein
VSFSNVGTIGSSTANSFSITPTSTNNWYLLGVLAGFPTSNVTSWAQSLAATNITWTPLVTHQQFANNAGQETLFLGKATAASAATTTVSFNTGTPTCRTAWQQFSNTAGFNAVTLDNQGTADTLSGGTLPSVTPLHGAGDLYWCFVWDNGTGVTTGASSGYTNQVDANGNIMAYNLNCTSSTQSPAFGDSATDGVSGIGVMLYEAIAGASTVPIVSPSAAAMRAASW